MNICILQHVPFEGAGTILPYFQGAENASSKHRIKLVHLYRGDSLPSPKWPDFLIVMGGPMGVHDLDAAPWLDAEKAFIRAVIDESAWVLGICLGAQLIADVLGAEVRVNHTPEIGWFPVARDAGFENHWLADILDSDFEALHWHGDTFELPERAISIGSSAACKNQGFVWQHRVIGLQFHLEFTLESTARLADNCPEDFVDADWVQSREEILSDPSRFENINRLMARILASVEQKIATDVQLHPLLDKDCHRIAETSDLWILLNKNASVPWFILVPKGKYRELDDLDQQQRDLLFDCASKVSDFLRARFNAEKINTAALGNMVPQLHLHVIGRDSQDPCWPNPVWGQLKECQEWAKTELNEIVEYFDKL